MRNELPFDEALAQRLPLPLAQLYRRAHNAKTAQERHHAAYYLWEAALKLLGSAAVVSFLQTGRTPDARLASVLQNLARPAVGHWWALVRALTIELADSDADFARLKDLLLGRARDDLPRLAGLDAALVAVLDGRGGGRSTVRLTELFDRLVRYRNQEIGHGAVGQRASRHYEEMSRALLAGVPQLLERLDVLAGRRLLYLADVRRLSSGAWLVERYELIGEAVRRLDSLERTHDEAAALLPQQVYLAGAALLPLHPLVAYDFEANEFLFLNARRGKQRVEYLCYTSGRPVDRVEASAQNALLAQLLDMPVDDARREEWQARSQADEPASEENQTSEARRTLGEFELLSELGHGGMGVVYRAWQPSLGRQVALKSLLKTGDAKSEKRFAREIAALGRVEHPHLVRIFTSGSEGDRWFYAMELIEGTTLATVCDRLSASGSSAGEVDLATWRQAVNTACEESRRSEKPLSDATPDAPAQPAPSEMEDGTVKTPAKARTGRAYVRQVVELMRQTAEAVHALHEKGIIHRDIKPGNIMIGPDGASATLMDLGLAQVADETEGRLTRTRQFVGTLRYASPEQVLAVARLDRRSDVYSLGATLWELLALRPLFGATDQMPTPELMQKIQIEEPGRVRRHNPEVPRDLAAVVDKCLQKDPKKRYATAQELTAELSAFLAGRPVQARPVTGPERLWKWARRRPAQAALLVMMVLTLLSLAVGGTLFAWQAEQARVDAEAHAQKQERLRQEADEKRDEADRHRREAEKQKGLAEQALGRAEKAEKRARDEAEQIKKERDRTSVALARSSVLLADREWEEGNVAHAQELLDDVPENLRHWERNYLHRKFQGSYCTLYGHTNGVHSVAFSPDGKRLASGSGDQTVKVWDATTGQELRTLKGHTNRVLSVAFSPDGKRLASASIDMTVKVWDAATGQELLTLKAHTAGVFFRVSVYSVAFSPDGKTLWSRGSGEKVWDLNTGKELTKPGQPPPFASIESAARSPAASLLALPVGELIHLVRMSPPDADELAFRKAKARFDPFWHEEQAAEAEKKSEWFAAAFHRAMLAENAPWNLKNWAKLQDACGKLGDSQHARAVCDRILQRDPTLAPLYLQRSLLRLRDKDAWGGRADLLRGVYFSLIDHPDWIEFADEATKQGKETADESDWPQAVRHYALASAWKPHDPSMLHRLAWATLANGDEEGCRAVCRRLHAHFGNVEGQRDLLTLSVMLGQRMHPLTPAPLMIERAVQQDAATRADAIARTATLLSDSGIDPKTLVALAAREVEVNPISAEYRETHGAALYRAGKYKDAVEQLEKARGSNWQKLFLAMAYHYLGDASKSREWFDKAKLSDKPGWEERLLYQRLRQEAAELRKTPRN